jgi:hypothetical protein
MFSMLNITKTGYSLSSMKHNKHVKVIINVTVILLVKDVIIDQPVPLI